MSHAPVATLRQSMERARTSTAGARVHAGGGCLRPIRLCTTTHMQAQPTTRPMFMPPALALYPSLGLHGAPFGPTPGEGETSPVRKRRNGSSAAAATPMVCQGAC
jgi:hypothetical protein